MSQFATIMRTVGMPVFERVLGDVATYTPPYTPPALPAPVATWAIVRVRSDLVGQYGERLEPRITAKLPRAEVPRPKIGAALAVGATVYRIDQQLEEGDWFITVALRVTP
jgi:hypothetical protein